MISHCCHNDEPVAQWTMFAQSRESKHNSFVCTFRIGLGCVAGCVCAKYCRTAELCTLLLSSIILSNIVQLQVFAQYSKVAVVCNDTQRAISLNFSQLSLQQYAASFLSKELFTLGQEAAAWDNAKKQPTSHLMDKVHGPD